MALGTADLSPLQLASAYAVFANGGRAVRPYFIAGVEDRHLHGTEFGDRRLDGVVQRAGVRHVNGEGLGAAARGVAGT